MKGEGRLRLGYRLLVIGYWGMGNSEKACDPVLAGGDDRHAGSGLRLRRWRARGQGTGEERGGTAEGREGRRCWGRAGGRGVIGRF